MCFQDLAIGAKNVKFYVNKRLVFDGMLDKGDEEAPTGHTILADLQNEKNESTDSATPSVAGVNGDENLGLRSSQPEKLW